MAPHDLYNPAFVGHLFDEMARTYGLVSLVSSLGFARRWRRQCLRSIQIDAGATVLDLMTGMGELCPDLAKQVGEQGRILALDVSPAMCARAGVTAMSRTPRRMQVLHADALMCPVDEESVDCVVSTFGLKTLNATQVQTLAAQVHRVLKPGGRFALLEISVPKSRLLRLPYLAYICHVIPLIGRISMGNPDNYRLLAVCTRAFRDCRQAANAFAAAGLAVRYGSHFFGCATAIAGHKPNQQGQQWHKPLADATGEARGKAWRTDARLTGCVGVGILSHHDPAA